MLGSQKVSERFAPGRVPLKGFNKCLRKKVVAQGVERGEVCYSHFSSFRFLAVMAFPLGFTSQSSYTLVHPSYLIIKKLFLTWLQRGVSDSEESDGSRPRQRGRKVPPVT